MSPTKLKAWMDLAEGLGKLKSTWPMRGWSWDNRLTCVTSSFSTQVEDAARLSAAQGLPVEWTPASLAKAPVRLRELATQYGDVRSGQLLLTAGNIEGLFAFGLWWPWGNGNTISLRVGLGFVDAAHEPSQQLRDLFNVALD
jgi:hypothetical protein